VKDGKFDLVLVKTLQHVNQYQNQSTVSASITAILPLPRAVYTGDEWGRVVRLSFFTVNFLHGTVTNV